MRDNTFHVQLRRSVSLLGMYSALAFVLVLLFSAVAPAQDNYRVTYFENNGRPGAPDAFIHVLNPGVASGGLCASIYVWRHDQELSECCSCPISNNGLLTLRVSALTNNPGDHAGIPGSGSVAIIADSNCDATNPAPTADLRAWATHVNPDTLTEGFDVSETEALDTQLSSGEQSEAAGRCGFIRVNGSGAGRCDLACGTTGG